MKKHISYPKIRQFRNTITDVKRQASFVGLDDNGDAIVNPSAKSPTIMFLGSIKIHGTNSSVVMDANGNMYAQSRGRVITPEKDNYGFAMFLEKNKESFRKLFHELCSFPNKHICDNELITIYGEWAGKGIQSGVGISEVDKQFYIFGAKVSVSKINEDDNIEWESTWLDANYIQCEEVGIYNMRKFGVYRIDINFNKPELAQAELIKITKEIEKECPVAKFFGISGVGEGAVWTGHYGTSVYRFKVKGEKHSASKVKTLAPIDVEKIKSIHAFVDYAVTENRFNQAIKEIFGEDDPDVKKLGDLIRWVIKDVMSEELDVLAKSNLIAKDVNKYVSHRTREMFFNLTI